MDVAPFFVDFHHFLSIFTIFLSIFTIYALLSQFTFCRDLRTFSANFLAKIAFSATSHVFCMYGLKCLLRASWSAPLWNVVSWSTEKMFETKRRLDCSPILRALLPLPVPLFEMLLPDQDRQRGLRQYSLQQNNLYILQFPRCSKVSYFYWQNTTSIQGRFLQGVFPSKQSNFVI